MPCKTRLPPAGTRAGGEAAAARPPRALTRGRRLPKNRNLLAEGEVARSGRRPPAVAALGALRGVLGKRANAGAAGPCAAPSPAAPGAGWKRGLFGTEGLSPGRRQHLMFIK